MAESPLASPLPLSPLPYHERLRDFLQREEPEVWNWYASHQVREEQCDAVRFELLKTTYRVDRDSQPSWYSLAECAAEELGLDVPVTLYQAQNPEGMNAGLAYLPGEAHIVLVGPVAEKLQEDELLALFAHELSHLLLWRGWEGEFLIVDQLLAALTCDRHAEPSHFASARLFQLYTEVFCDRGALHVVKDPLTVVAVLVKTITGLESVSAASYLKQAEEIFARGPTCSEGLTHPEAFIRARAVRLWHERHDAAEERIAEMIEGPLKLDQLDLLGQQGVRELTERMMRSLLVPSWMHSDTLLGHARLFFQEFAPPPPDYQDPSLASDLRTTDTTLIDYYCYVLLDFVTADRDLEEAPLAAALQLAESLEFKDRFAEIARKELKLRKRQFEKVDREKHDLLARAAKELVQS